MKKLLTVVVFGQTELNFDELPYEKAEFTVCESKADVQRAVKRANGKYAVVCEGGVKLNDLQPLLNAADGASADIIAFTGGAAYKPSILKGLDGADCADRLFNVYAAMQCKSILKTELTPFAFAKNVEPCEAKCAELLRACKQFKEVKAKLAREVYTYVFENLCACLTKFYMRAMLEMRSGSFTAQQLIEFDSALKDEIVLYLAVDKRFTAAPLKKLRDKQFKISFITANRIKKLLK